MRPFDLEDIHEWLLRETSSEPSGENATLFACDRCPPHFVFKFAAFFSKFLYFISFCFFRMADSGILSLVH